MAGRKEARIFASIWNDEEFLALTPREQRLYFFLLSQKDLSYCGVISLRMRRWARSAEGLTAAQVEEDLKALTRPFQHSSADGDPVEPSRPLIVVDEDTEEVFVRSLIRLDRIWTIPNLLKSAREAATLVESPTILAELLEELRRIPVHESQSRQVKVILAEFIADLEHSLGKGSGTPPPKGSADPSENSKPNPAADRSTEAKADHHRRPAVSEPQEPESARTRLRAVPDLDLKLTGNALLDEHINACITRPPRRVLTRTGQHIDELLNEGIAADDIRKGLTLLRQRPKVGPGLLPDLVHEARIAAAGGPPPARHTGRRSGANVHHEHAAGAELAKGFQ